MPKPRKPSAPPRFAVGDAVRVKAGVKGPDFPDLPMGGWCGAVEEVEAGSPPTYLVQWNDRTMKSIHPIFRKRCERDGLDWEAMWLAEGDLEPDTGEPVQVEQPTQIVTKPLSPKEQDDRLRMIFGLTSDDPVPDVDEAMLLQYHQHLAKSLSFPFEAQYSEESAVTVVGLLDPDEYPVDEHYGLFCAAREGRRMVQLPLSEIDVTKRHPNSQLLDDYSYWFWNWR